jgi:hypothetical protein
MPLLHISLNTDSDNHILSGDTCKFRVNLGHTIYPQHLKLRRAHVTATGYNGALGTITTAVISAAGNGYTPGTYDIALTGGTGLRARASISVDATGAVSSISIINTGYGYTASDVLTGDLPSGASASPWNATVNAVAAAPANTAIAGGNNVALVRFDTGVASDQFTNNLGVAGLLAIPMDYTKDRAPTQTYAGLGEGFMLGDANQGWTQHDRNGILVEVFKSDGKTHLPWTAKEGTPGTAEVQQIDLVFEFSQFDESKPTMYEFS